MAAIQIAGTISKPQAGSFFLAGGLLYEKWKPHTMQSDFCGTARFELTLLGNMNYAHPIGAKTMDTHLVGCCGRYSAFGQMGIGYRKEAISLHFYPTRPTLAPINQAPSGFKIQLATLILNNICGKTTVVATATRRAGGSAAVSGAAA